MGVPPKRMPQLLLLESSQVVITKLIKRFFKKMPFLPASIKQRLQSDLSVLHSIIICYIRKNNTRTNHDGTGECRTGAVLVLGDLRLRQRQVHRLLRCREVLVPNARQVPHRPRQRGGEEYRIQDEDATTPWRRDKVHDSAHKSLPQEGPPRSSPGHLHDKAHERRKVQESLQINNHYCSREDIIRSGTILLSMTLPIEYNRALAQQSKNTINLTMSMRESDDRPSCPRFIENFTVSTFRRVFLKSTVLSSSNDDQDTAKRSRDDTLKAKRTAHVLLRMTADEAEGKQKVCDNLVGNFAASSVAPCARVPVRMDSDKFLDFCKAFSRGRERTQRRYTDSDAFVPTAQLIEEPTQEPINNARDAAKNEAGTEEGTPEPARPVPRRRSHETDLNRLLRPSQEYNRRVL